MITLSIISAVLFLLPIVYIFLISFKLPRDIFQVPPSIISPITFDNYTSYWEQAHIGSRLINTIVISIGAAVFSMVVGAMAGYGLTRLKLKGARWIAAGILISRAVPPIVLAVPIFLVARGMGLVDQHITLIVAYCSFLIPYVVWLSRAFFMSLPPELEESARVDGCTRYGAFFRIIVPISLPSLMATFVFSILIAWQELLFALVLTNNNAVTIPVVLTSMTANSYEGSLWGPMAAVSVITVVPMVILALAVQKTLISGLAEGATKG